jgi:ABC-type uncharacterized transport system involved in gliding motility auxiliary subunit
MRWERRLALASAGVGLLLLLATLSLILVDRSLSQRTAFTLFAGLALVIVYVVLDPSAVIDLVHNPRARFGSLSVLVSALALGVLIAVNVVASRGTQAVDLTRSGLHTLSPKSVLVTKHLDSDLQVTGFFRPDEQSTKRDVQSLLNLYGEQSPHVKVRFVDPDQNAAQAISFGVTIPGSIVLQYKNRTPVVLNLAQQTEADLTGAIIRLESNRTPVVCWAAGDGERDRNDANQVTGYSSAAELLKTSNYQLQDVLLVQQGVPAACDVLVVLQLGRPLAENSVKAIRDYLGRGGKLLIGMDPWTDAKVLASANAVLQPYGVAFDGGLVVEPDASHAATNDPTVPVVYSYGDSPITKDLANKYVFFPQSTPVTSPATNAVSVSLASTTDRAYSIPQQRTALDRRPTDKAGPFVVMESVEQQLSSGKAARVIVVGTSALGENRTMPPSASGSNPDLLLASLDWLSEQDSLISIGPKPPAAAPLSLTDQDTRVNEILTLGVLPLLIVFTGLLVRMRRRRRFASA